MLIIKKNHHDILFPYRVTSLVPHWGSVSDHEGVSHRKKECSSFCHMTCSSALLFLSKASVMLQYTTLEISQLKEENTVFYFLWRRCWGACLSSSWHSSWQTWSDFWPKLLMNWYAGDFPEKLLEESHRCVVLPVLQQVLAAVSRQAEARSRWNIRRGVSSQPWVCTESRS